MTWLRRLVFVAALLLLLALPGRMQQQVKAEDLQRVERERTELQQRNAKLRGDIALLEAEIRALKLDPREIERIARQDLNLVRPGEVVFEVEQAGPAKLDKGKP